LLKAGSKRIFKNNFGLFLQASKKKADLGRRFSSWQRNWSDIANTTLSGFKLRTYGGEKVGWKKGKKEGGEDERSLRKTKVTVRKRLLC